MAKVDDLFRTAEFFTAEDEILDDALKELSMRDVPNSTVQHREVIRAITINAIKNQRHIDRIERRNRILTWILITLTVTSILFSIATFLVQ